MGMDVLDSADSFEQFVLLSVVELTVAASRLGVDAYDQRALRERLAYFADVVETCGGPREREALARTRELVDAEF